MSAQSVFLGKDLERRQAAEQLDKSAKGVISVRGARSFPKIFLYIAPFLLLIRCYTLLPVVYISYDPARSLVLILMTQILCILIPCTIATAGQRPLHIPIIPENVHDISHSFN